jgi:aryl-alcohol dehydrogenase-like predicted oxidoreductase
LRRLGIERVDGLLVHSAGDLRGPHGDAFYRALAAAKDEGLTRQIGVSAYTPEELDSLVGRFAFDAVQIPFNVLDRRFVTSGVLARCRHLGISVYARSAFLQGLLLMDPSAIPSHAAAARPSIAAFAETCRGTGASRLLASLRCALDEPLIDWVVVGVTGLRELDEILAAAATPLDAALDLGRLAVTDEAIIDPRRWR